MIKNFILLPFLLFSSLFAYPRCSSELASALKCVYQFPEGKKLIEQVETEGPLVIYRAPFNSNSHAMWIASKRAIVINVRRFRTFGETVRSILFELHNANTSRQFAQLDWLAQHHRISKSEYVEATERLEHKNAYRTSRLIDRAIQRGYFPPDAMWSIPTDFHTHFLVQKKAGHSANIAAIFDSLTRQNYYGNCY